MEELIKEALTIISSFDWYWQMDDYGYKQNQKKAESQKNQFRIVLSKIDDNEIVELLRQLWILNYKLTRPYETEEYYTEVKAELKTAETKLEQLKESLITI